MEPESSDAFSAAFVARYDRELAAAMFPRADRVVTPTEQEDNCRPLEARFLVNPANVMRELASDAITNQIRERRLNEAFLLIRLLPLEPPRRWNLLSIQRDLWIPDDGYCYD